jgi:hypothetical protein
MDDFDDIVDPDGPPPWLHLLNRIQKAWRETEILKGRYPDTHIERELKRAKRWPPVKKVKKAKKTKKAVKYAKKPQRRKTSR